jgi:hypothetical protein
MKYEPKDILIGLGKARIDAYNHKLEADGIYYEAEEKFKAMKADVMLSNAVSGLGSREMREAQADLVLSNMDGYKDYLVKKLASKRAYERQAMIGDLIGIAKTLANGSMLDRDAGALLEGIDEKTVERD